MDDVLVVGGGIIGLSLACELARHGAKVQVIDQGLPGREASWAGAGILPAASRGGSQHPYEQLCGLAAELHPAWAEQLRSLTGIDTGYRRSGGVHLAQSPGEAAALAGWAGLMRAEGIAVEELSAADLGEIEPGISSATETSYRRRAFLVPDEAQLRNPHHLQALLRACELAGARINPHTPAGEAIVREGQLVAVETPAGRLAARQFCFTAGAWTGAILQQMHIAAGILPIRGQMVLFRCPRPPIGRIINVGSRYLVPRDDGRVLAGATEEEVGFDKRNTDEAVADLIAFARGIVPALAAAPIERTWAGLRPGSFDGLPYLGRLPGLGNAFVAAGHFRSGLFLSPATAVVMGQLVRGVQPQIDLAPFRIGR
jgi:glycine oxidase